MIIKKIVIYGERCSGTNYLENSLKKNFNCSIEKYKYYHKHFFGFFDFENDKNLDTDNTIFIGIVREPFEWMNSFRKKQFHLPKHLKENNYNF